MIAFGLYILQIKFTLEQVTQKYKIRALFK